MPAYLCTPRLAGDRWPASLITARDADEAAAVLADGWEALYGVRPDGVEVERVEVAGVFAQV